MSQENPTQVVLGTGATPLASEREHQSPQWSIRRGATCVSLPGFEHRPAPSQGIRRSVVRATSGRAMYPVPIDEVAAIARYDGRVVVVVGPAAAGLDPEPTRWMYGSQPLPLHTS